MACRYQLEVWCYKPFYITNPSEKEKEICLCKLCLNKRLLFKSLHKKYSEMGDSLSGYLMGKCDCPKDENGFWRSKCCVGKCSSCKVKRQERIEIPGLQTDTSLIKFYQFEETQTPYVCKKTGEMKISKKVERSAEKHETAKFIHELLMEKYDEYLYHWYQVQNDKFVWKQIVESIDSPIFHMDYSENLAPTSKFEPQSAHFSKRQFSLHCTVMHSEDSNKFIYHLSDDMGHDSTFTMAVVDDLVTRFASDNNIIRFKSDNCSKQYKCKYVFYEWRALAVKLQKIFLVCYGVSGHGKGLVDAMSGFGVKAPMRKAIVTHDFFFNNTKTLQEYMISLNLKSDREYFHFDVFERKPKEEKGRLPISKCMKQHMFAYFPNGSIQYKENICCCKNCMVGKLVRCRLEKGVKMFAADDSSSSDSDSDGDSGSDSSSESDDEEECYKIIGDTVFEAVEVGRFVAIYSPPNASELFYHCEVVEKEVAKKDVSDEFHRTISQGSAFLKCKYLEKVDEKKGMVRYKRVQGIAYVLPYQVFLPAVEVSEKLTIDSFQYMDLISMI